MTKAKLNKVSLPPPVVRSVIEKYPDFTKRVQEILFKLPPNDFFDILLSILSDGRITFPKGFEKNIVEAMVLLGNTAPVEVVNSLFSSIEDEQFSDADAYTSAIHTLNVITDNSDKPRLIKVIVGYLSNNVENKHQEIVGVLQELTFNNLK
jgi:hypothetical protein